MKKVSSFQVHIRSPFILNGVCVRWKGYLDLERLDGVGCIEFDEETATLEDAIMRDTVEAYNRRIKDFEEHNKARQRQLAAFMGHQQQVAAALQQQLDNASSNSTSSTTASNSVTTSSQPPLVTSPTNNNLISSSTTCANSHLGPSSHPEEPVSRLSYFRKQLSKRLTVVENHRKKFHSTLRPKRATFTI